jgi:hypothetical protein
VLSKFGRIRKGGWHVGTEKLADAESRAGADACRTLKNYQLYFMTPAGNADRREYFELLSDKEALVHAKQFVDGKALELWSGMRMVGRLESEETPGSKEVTP